MFKRGDHVTVVNDDYAEPGRSLAGATGQITDAGDRIVRVRLDDGTGTTGFGVEEVQHTR